MITYWRKGDFIIDHANRDKLDNRMSNLRNATKAQNQINAGVSRANTSGYKGVSRAFKDGREKCWSAKISKNDKSIHIGMFATAEGAARAYDEAAKKYHGKFAYLNFP